MIENSSYANRLRFPLRRHHNKILPGDLQIKSKTMSQHAGKLLLQEGIHINHVICDRLKNSKGRPFP